MWDTFFTAWQFASEDRSEALLNVVVLSPEATACPIHLRLRGLDSDALYTLEGIGTVFSGAAPDVRRIYAPADAPRLSVRAITFSENGESI